MKNILIPFLLLAFILFFACTSEDETKSKSGLGLPGSLNSNVPNSVKSTGKAVTTSVGFGLVQGQLAGALGELNFVNSLLQAFTANEEVIVAADALSGWTTASFTFGSEVLSLKFKYKNDNGNKTIWLADPADSTYKVKLIWSSEQVGEFIIEVSDPSTITYSFKWDLTNDQNKLTTTTVEGADMQKVQVNKTNPDPNNTLVELECELSGSAYIYKLLGAADNAGGEIIFEVGASGSTDQEKYRELFDSTGALLTPYGSYIWNSTDGKWYACDTNGSVLAGPIEYTEPTNNYSDDLPISGTVDNWDAESDPNYGTDFDSNPESEIPPEEFA